MKLLLAAGLALAMVVQDRAPIVQSVDISVPFTPAMFTQDGRLHIAYEVHITNFQQVDVTLTGLRLSGGGAPMMEYRDAELHRRIVRPGFRNDFATPQVIGPGQRAIINLWFQQPQFVSTKSITHHVELDVMRPAGAVRAEASSTVMVPAWTPLNLGPPLKGGHWVAVYDPMLKGGHRTAVYTIDGRARIPGRFAIDFIKLPPSGAMIRNQSPRPPDLNGFGSDVLAVADGTIAAAVDDTTDDMSPSNSAQGRPPVPPESASGNYISLDIGGGHFVFYEHLQQGSLQVKSGDRVRRGQAIARLGSSGSTSIGPHLHFHVADANSLLGAEGVPFGFDQFTVFGDFASLADLVAGEPWRPGQVARSSATTRPSPNVALSFQ